MLQSLARDSNVPFSPSTTYNDRTIMDTRCQQIHSCLISNPLKLSLSNIKSTKL
jgi:hypothetical protein